MGEGQGSAGEKVDTERELTPEQVHEEIERTRAELGDTVAELAAKTDVKAQAHRAVDNAKATVTGKAREVKSSAEAKKIELTAAAREATPPSAEVARRRLITQAQRHRLALVALLALGTGLLIGRRRA
jgi:ribosome-binding protein aMBF1 (putative translation factor)